MWTLNIQCNHGTENRESEFDKFFFAGTSKRIGGQPKVKKEAEGSEREGARNYRFGEGNRRS